jgi:hypothetical protein
MKRVMMFIFSVMLLTSFVLASSPSETFKGDIISDISPNGMYIIGYVNGIATGKALIEDGRFEIVVTDNTGNGGKVEFYIGTEKTDGEFVFSPDETKRVTLTFNRMSGFNSCGNGVCEGGECSFCAIDCNSCEAETTITRGNESIKDELLPEINETENNESLASPITGAATGLSDFVKSEKGIYVIIGAVTVLVFIIAVFIGRKKKSTEKETPAKEKKA